MKFLNIIFILLIASQSISQIKYKKPYLSEGEQLEVNAEAKTHLNLINLVPPNSIDGNLRFIKFRYTEQLDYVINPEINVSSYLTDDGNYNSNVYLKINTNLNLILNGGLSYYPFKKNKFYTGITGSSRFRLENKIDQENYNRITADYYIHAGYGKIYNTEQLDRTYNFESELLSLGILTKELDPATNYELTSLLDKRKNSEYKLKYKDEDEIQFFSDVENLLKRKGYIKDNLGAEATIALYELLSKDIYIYYPSFDGFQLQTSFGQHKTNSSNFEEENENIQSLILSGFYGKTFGEKLKAIGIISFGIPLKISSKWQYGFYYNPKDLFFPLFNQPFTLTTTKDNFVSFAYPTLAHKQKFLLTSSLSAGYNISSVSGISLSADYIFASAEENETYNFFKMSGAFNYQILTKLYAGAGIAYYADLNNKELRFSAGTSYIIF